MVAFGSKLKQKLYLKLKWSGILSDDVFVFIGRTSKSELLRFFQQKQTFIHVRMNKAVIEMTVI